MHYILMRNETRKNTGTVDKMANICNGPLVIFFRFWQERNDVISVM